MCLEMSQSCQTQGVRSKKEKEKKRQIKQGNIQYGHREAVFIFKYYNRYIFLKNPKIKSARHSSVKQETSIQQELIMMSRFGNSREAPTL